MKKIVIDLDKTITCGHDKDYEKVKPNLEIIKKLNSYKDKGFSIIIYTSRNMRTYSNNVEKIKLNTLPKIIKWLKKYNVPYDEIIIGKPWCGERGFYVDDKSIRPSEFLNLSYKEIKKIVDI